jgi:hypothetical protein
MKRENNARKWKRSLKEGEEIEPENRNRRNLEARMGRKMNKRGGARV